WVTMKLMFSSPLLRHTGARCQPASVIGRVAGACTKSKSDPLKMYADSWDHDFYVERACYREFGRRTAVVVDGKGYACYRGLSPRSTSSLNYTYTPRLDKRGWATLFLTL
ncbi:MAG TPA: hypothetical protein VK281_06715, partial [Xanthobacteraceae bacterium]|nr:hypothetical protein [Xanthobacteraceae bacterium]